MVLTGPALALIAITLLAFLAVLLASVYFLPPLLRESDDAHADQHA